MLLFPEILTLANNCILPGKYTNQDQLAQELLPRTTEPSQKLIF